MDLSDFLHRIKTAPNQIEFEECIDVVDSNYHFTPNAFKNGNFKNEKGQNNGSCKIFAFGILHKLTKAQTLACFGKHYRESVLSNPEGTDHQNIRNFIKYGWENLVFESFPLIEINK